MLKLEIKAEELYDEANEEFITIKPTTLLLEHSLISISKWEARWEKPFISQSPKTVAEVIDYIRCMTINQNVDPNVYFAIGSDEIEKVNAYIGSKQSATWFTEQKSYKRSSEAVTSELIYYWMTMFNIPFEVCEKWHLNRLMNLIRICSIKNGPKKKMSKRSVMEENARLNAERKRKYGTKG